jgi:transposase
MRVRIVVRLDRSARRRLLKMRGKTKDAALRTRVDIVLHYADGLGCDRIADALHIRPSTATRVARRYLDEGERGLIDHRGENGVPKVDDDLLQLVAELLQSTPPAYGYERPTWSRELIAKLVKQKTGTELSRTSVSRLLKRLGARWGAARPTVNCPWRKSRKAKRLREIRRLIEGLKSDEVAFYEDEIDIHLNPKIGRDWMLPRTQRIVMTPGKNQKAYLAGALRVDGGDLRWVEGDRKNTDLFLALLEALLAAYPAAKKIHLVLDNFVIHSTNRVAKFLREDGARIRLHFLPPYCPNDNPIERFWRDLHAEVTRNHACGTLRQLVGNVHRFMRRAARTRRLSVIRRKSRRAA